MIRQSKRLKKPFDYLSFRYLVLQKFVLINKNFSKAFFAIIDEVINKLEMNIW